MSAPDRVSVSESFATRDERRRRVASLFREGLNPREISERIGFSRTTVVKDLRGQGLFRKVDKELRDTEIVRLYSWGKMQWEVAELMGLSQATVCSVLKARGVPTHLETSKKEADP